MTLIVQMFLIDFKLFFGFFFLLPRAPCWKLFRLSVFWLSWRFSRWFIDAHEQSLGLFSDLYYWFVSSSKFAIEKNHQVDY